jgi:hypothetical protein
VRQYRKQANQLTSTEAAYVAGFVDGEGCISAGCRRNCIEGGISVGSTNRDVLLYLRSVTGVGCVGSIGRKRKKNHRPVYTWDVSVASVKSLLIQLIPFLQVKRRQAELMIELFSFGKYPTLIESPTQVNMVQQFRELNRRGEIELSV